MERIAFINGDTFIYWSPIILALAAVAAVGFYGGAYFCRGGKILGFAFSTALSLVLGIPLARLIHWYCRTAAYESFDAAMTDYTHGGYALAGVIFGCILAACITRLLRLCKSLPKMLDAMAIGGAVGIAAGRMASMFNVSDRGMIVPDSVGFPFASVMINSVSGSAENRLATFMLQGMLAAAIAVILIGYLVIRALLKKKAPGGDAALLFLLLYGASQAICDSTRYDSLFLRSNGFVSIVQILGLVGLLIPIAVFSVALVRRRGLKWYAFALWGGIAGLLGLAGYMEYYVQRHGNEAVLAYSVMGASLVAVILLGVTVMVLSRLPVAKSVAPPRA